MKAKEMLHNRRYITGSGIKFKVKYKMEDHFIVERISDGSQLSVPFDYDIEPLSWGKYRLSEDNINELLSYIKNTYMYWEKKKYITFMKDKVKYKIDYAAQKLLSRKYLDGIQEDKKYKNGYYAYKLHKVMGFIKGNNEIYR